MVRAFWETDMLWERKFAAPVIGLMIAAAGVAWANEQGGAVAPLPQSHAVAPVATPPAGAVDALSPGNRLIAQALFAAQRTGAAWPLERIAALRIDGQNWGDVFEQMKSQNLLQADTLGQVVSWYQYNYVKPEPTPRELRSSIATVPVRERNSGN